MKTIDKGCAFDSNTREWAVWMNKPKGLSLPNRILYHNNGECKFQNYKNKKGVDMFVIRGTLPPNVVDVKGVLIQMRRDLSNYVNNKKKEAGLK